jgi:hypothetical protein
VSTAGRIKGFSIVDRSRMSALLPKTTRVYTKRRMSAIYPLWASIVSDFEQTLISNAPVQLQVIASLNVIDIRYCSDRDCRIYGMEYIVLCSPLKLPRLGVKCQVYACEVSYGRRAEQAEFLENSARYFDGVADYGGWWFAGGAALPWERQTTGSYYSRRPAKNASGTATQGNRNITESDETF